MNLLRPFILAVLILALASCGGPAKTTTTAPPASYEFRRLCLDMGIQGGKISREQFLAASKDKETAAQLFDACDVHKTGYLTEEQATQNPVYFEDLRNQVIQFRTTR